MSKNNISFYNFRIKEFYILMSCLIRSDWFKIRVPAFLLIFKQTNQINGNTETIRMKDVDFQCCRITQRIATMAEMEHWLEKDYKISQLLTSIANSLLQDVKTLYVVIAPLF